MRAVLLAAVVAAGAALVPGTDASFDGQASSPSVVSLLAVGPASSLVVEPAGNDVALTWSAGTNGSAYDVRAGGTCAALSTIAQPTTTSHTDTPAVDPGTPRCYGVVTRQGSWTSATGNPAVVVQVGFVATAVTMSEGNGELDTGDTFTVTFNQPAAPVAVDEVAVVDGVVNIGVGTLTDGTADADARFEATSAWSNGNRMVTITVGERVEGASDPQVTGPWTLHPSGVVSATGNVAVCGSCTPTTS